MEKHQILTEYIEHQNSDTLSPIIQDLLQASVDASKLAYAPYSKFKVGASLLLSNGKIVLGSNQENASYPVGTCAERVALHNWAMLHAAHKIVAIAIFAATKSQQKPTAPCGMCRQALYEREINQKSPIKVYLKGSNSKIIELHQIKDLLPLGFAPDSLL